MGRQIEKKLLHQQVYEILKSDILIGKLGCGEKLNENLIAQNLGVSRSPVREAIRMLEQDELVVLGTAGTIVNPLENRMMEERYECRVVMESYAVRLATLIYTKEQLEELHCLLDESARAFDEGRIDDVIQCNTEFHLLLIMPCRNDRLIRTIKKYQELSFLARKQEFYAFHKGNFFIGEHRKILEVIQKKDPDEVEAYMRIHLQNDLEFYRNNVSR